MKYKIIICLTTIFLLTSCTSFSLFSGGSKGTQIPSKPQRTFESMEDIKSNIGVIVDISHEAYTSGVNAHSYESETLLKSAKVLQTVSGLPTEQINWKIKKEVEELHKKILHSEEEYRLEKAEWEAEIASLQNETEYLKNKNSKLSSALDTVTFWFWFTVIALGVLTFLCPTIGIPLIKFLVGRAKNLGEKAVVETTSALKGQFSQVVDAIEHYKKEDPEQAKKLLEHLEKKTDSTTRKLISEIKHK